MSSQTGPINPTDAMFDHIVIEERKIGLTIDLSSSKRPTILPINGSLLEASHEYKAAMQRRLARLLNNRPSKERLHWDSESFAMNLRTTETGSKNVRYIAMYVPITEGELCDCGCGKRDHECVRFRKELSMVFIFDREPIDLAQTKTYQSKQSNGRVILNDELDGADGFAWLRAHCKTQEVEWKWSGQHTLDLNVVWLHIFNALIPIAAETSDLYRERRIARAARKLTRINLPPALTAEDLHDRLVSWRLSSPLSSSLGEGVVADFEPMVALDRAGWPCGHGHAFGNCGNCDKS
jgi:hypothetical protein